MIIYPGSGTGAWEAAIVNTLSPGDRVLLFETGHFSQLWRQLVEKFGVQVDYVPGNWRRGANAAELEARLGADREHALKAVLVVHNETSTGVTSRIAEIRRAMNRAGHPALLLVDTISSLGSIDYRHDEWGVDVTIAGSQKGPDAAAGHELQCHFRKGARAKQELPGCRGLIGTGRKCSSRIAAAFSPTRPRPICFTRLREALQMLHEEGLAECFPAPRASRGSDARGGAAWGLEIVCEEPREYSNSLTAVFMPEGFDADQLRAVILENFDMSLGAGLSKLAGKVFRIGHLGSFNDLMLAGTLSGVEMGLQLAGVPHKKGGVAAALDHLVKTAPKPNVPVPAR